MPVFNCDTDMRNHLESAMSSAIRFPQGFDVFFQAARDFAEEFPSLRKLTPATDSIEVLQDDKTHEPLAYVAYVDKKWYVTSKKPVIEPSAPVLLTRAIRAAQGR